MPLEVVSAHDPAKWGGICPLAVEVARGAYCQVGARLVQGTISDGRQTRHSCTDGNDRDLLFYFYQKVVMHIIYPL